ncbi:CRISPR locus-related DNA-binding protein [Halobacterium salinarum]|uniref:CRISPR-associated CARF protein Csa3 n=1 Tax=Halobacterium salinarum TaxID=2242 RepID=UPI001F196BFD|nr:CRISPR-associated CARF protein Csa3 [Halobacterium salinarum]MCF2206077.1 CRISPR locus-related DNA-binding protein [Halobacterium salinarum]MCF2239967.1 CRISPR locus-related DNA-binding protein [Halobacterium salinarum]
MRTYVSTIGYYDTRVVRPVLGHGLNEDDVVVLLRPYNDDEDGDSAVEDVKQIFSELGPDVEVAVESVTYNEFSQAVLECIDVLTAAEGETIANFGGGPREIFLAFTVAALVADEEIDTVLQYTDIDEEVQELRLPNLMGRPPAKTYKTLQTVTDLGGESTLPEVAERSDQSRSTIGRHLDELEAAGAIETEKKSKTRHIALTLSGRLQLTRFS